MEAAYRSLEDLSRQQKDKLTEKEKLAARLSELQKIITHTCEEQKKLQQVKNTVQEKWAIREKEIASAVAVDQLIELEEKKLVSIKHTIAQLSKNVRRADMKTHTSQKALNDQRKKVEALESFLVKNYSDSQLGNAQTGISQKITELKQFRRSISKKQSQLSNLKKEQERLSKEFAATAKLHV